jgi:hypothetical protein
LCILTTNKEIKGRDGKMCQNLLAGVATARIGGKVGSNRWVSVLILGLARQSKLLVNFNLKKY